MCYTSKFIWHFIFACPGAVREKEHTKDPEKCKMKQDKLTRRGGAGRGGRAGNQSCYKNDIGSRQTKRESLSLHRHEGSKRVRHITHLILFKILLPC